MSLRWYARAVGTAATVIGLGGCLVSIDESRIDGRKLDATTGAQDAGDGGPGVTDGSDAAVSFCPQGAIFCDGFEGAIDDGTWERSSPRGFLSYDTAPARVFSGKSSLRIAAGPTGTAAVDYLSRVVTLPAVTAAPTVRVTLRAYLESKTENVNGLTLHFQDMELGIDLATGYALEKIDTTRHEMSGAPILPLGGWHEVRVDLQRQQRTVVLAIDGTPGAIVDTGGKGLAAQAQLQANQMSLCVGTCYVAAGQSWKMWVDDVVVTAF